MPDPDPLHQNSGPATFWTTVNATEAIPGTTTPLTWSFYADATDRALRGTFAEIGSLPRSAAGAALSDRPDERFLGIFFGHPAANMNLFRRMADLTPGGSGDALEQQFFGTKRSGVAPVRSKRRYPVVAVRMPLAARRAPHRLRAIHDEVDAWWRAVVAVPDLTPERARTLLTDAADRYRQVLHWHGVGTMLTQGIFDQLCTVTAAAGRPGHELQLVAGVELTETGVLDDLWRASRDRLTVEDVVHRHGCHGRDAGELSVRSWREDPAQAAAAVEHYRSLPDDRAPRASVARVTAQAAAARAAFLAGLGPAGRAKARLLLGLVLRFMPLREVGRSALLRALDGGRLAARALGADLHRRGVLADPEDAFFLTIPELVGRLPDGPAHAVELRRKRFAEYAGLGLPDAWLGNPEPRPMPPPREARGPGGGALSGVAASTGSVTGVARVVDDPDTADIEPGEILVCHTTDPSWASLMSLAAGLVIDVGGPLSHGAIVARELGVPCVIGTVDGTRTIRTGDTVHVDGTAGVVTIEEMP